MPLHPPFIQSLLLLSSASSTANPYNIFFFLNVPHSGPQGINLPNLFILSKFHPQHPPILSHPTNLSSIKHTLSRHNSTLLRDFKKPPFFFSKLFFLLSYQILHHSPFHHPSFNHTFPPKKKKKMKPPNKHIKRQNSKKGKELDERRKKSDNKRKRLICSVV